MGLASALSTALTGLNAAETTIDVVGNNVANANTVGFKASKAVFATQFLQTRSLGSGPTASRGGTNPRQTGLGTKVAEITPDFTQGTIQISANASDLAIQGDGFFVVEGAQGEQLFSRNGILKTNSQNELVTINGQRLLGHAANESFEIETTELQPLVIPLGSTAVAQRTENVVLQGTLSPTGDVASLAEIIQSSILSDGQYEIPDGSDQTGTIVNPPTATVTGSAAAGGALPVGDHHYKITFSDVSGNLESPPTAFFGPFTTTGANATVDLAGLPGTIPAGFSRVNIYRSDNGEDGDYSQVGFITSGTTFSDTAAAGTTALDEGLASGIYGYYVTFYSSTSTVESRPTELLEVTLNADGRGIQLDNLPVPTDADFDQIRIYRSVATTGTPTFHFLTELSAGTTSYIDNDPDDEISANVQVNLDGPAIQQDTLLTDLVQFDGNSYENLFAEGLLEFTGRKGGRTLSTKMLEITATTQVSDLIDFMEGALGIQPVTADTSNPIPGTPGGSIVTEGSGSPQSRLQFIGNNGTANAVEVGLSSFKLTPTAGTQESVNLAFDATQEAVGESAVTDFVVFDSLGIPLEVRVTAVLESRDNNSTTYRWFADSGDNDPESGSDISVGTGLLIFDGEGNLTTTTNTTVAVERENISSASPLEFELDFSQVSGLAADNSSLAATRQDGSGPGTLASFIIGEDGLIRGVFSNGITRDLGQVRLVRFSNNSGLEQRGENLFAEGVNSGLPIEGNPGENGIGSLIAGATELSNTDIGQNLIDLITASTQYRGGTRVITAVQQLLDELMNLRR